MIYEVEYEKFDRNYWCTKPMNIKIRVQARKYIGMAKCGYYWSQNSDEERIQSLLIGHTAFNVK